MSSTRPRSSGGGALMAQCEAMRIGRPDRGDQPRQCKRNAVAGSKFCQAHGGVEDSTTPELINQNDPRTHNSVRCTATSKRSGERCLRQAVIGATVCYHHGGRAPQTVKKAQARLDEMVGPAIEQLQKILTKPNTSDADRLRAIALLLDRTGFGPQKNVGVDMNVRKFEHVITEIIREAPDDDLDTSQIIPGQIVEEAIDVPVEPSDASDWEPEAEPDPGLAPIVELRPVVVVGQANPPSRWR